MTGRPAPDPIPPFVLLGMTAVTGIVDAVSFLALGHVFTAEHDGQRGVSRICGCRGGRSFSCALLHRPGRVSFWGSSGRTNGVSSDVAPRASLGQPRLRRGRRALAGRGRHSTRTARFVRRGLGSAVCGHHAHGDRDGISKRDGTPARDRRFDYYRPDIDDYRTGSGFFAGRWNESPVAPPACFHTLHVGGSCGRRLHAEALGCFASPGMRPRLGCGRADGSE